VTLVSFTQKYSIVYRSNNNVSYQILSKLQSIDFVIYWIEIMK